MEKGSQEKTVGTEPQYQLEKNYDIEHENGTTGKVTIKIEMDDYNGKDFDKVLSEFAATSRCFYLDVAQDIKNRL